MTDTAIPQQHQRPVRHLVVFANPSASSFDRAVVDTFVAEAERRGQEVMVRDLYAMGFDPVLRAEERPAPTHWAPSPDVEAELALLHACDTIVLVYPIWFGLPPAMLKGYVDRVFGAGYSFRNMQNGTGQPALAHKHLLSFSTSGTILSWLNERSQVLSLREIFDVYLWRGFGMKQSEHIMIDSVVPNMSTAYAKEQLERVRSTAERLCASVAMDRQMARTTEELPRPIEKTRA